MRWDMQLQQQGKQSGVWLEKFPSFIMYKVDLKRLTRNNSEAVSISTYVFFTNWTDECQKAHFAFLCSVPQVLVCCPLSRIMSGKFDAGKLPGVFNK